MKRLLALSAATVVCSAAALAAPSHFVKVSPSPVQTGNSVKVSGSVGNGCAKGSQVTLYSKAFKDATSKSFAGIPAVFTTVGSSGKFSKKVTISVTVSSGKYRVSGRCGGGKFGSAKLKVSGQFY
jgi:hypothetical protein